jgi:outer membrane protein assembly factor BamB
MLGLALALALSAPAAQGASLPPPPRALYSLLWRRDLAAKTMGEWEPAEPGGPVYDPVTKLVVVGTRDGVLHALREDGSVAWDFRSQGPFAAEPLVDGDTVYAGCNDGRLYALALTTGQERWRYETREQLGTRPALADGLIIVASLQDTVFAVDARTGAWKWHYRREPREGFTVFGAAAVAVAGGLVHAGFSDGTLVALDASSGVVRWERHAAPSGAYPDVDSLVVSEGKVYAAAFSGAVVALEAATGRPLWQFETPEPSRVAMVSGFLIVVSTKSIMALAPVNGHVLWTTPYKGTPAGEPRAAGRWIIVPSGLGGLHFVELASGRIIKTLEPGSGISAPLAILGRRVWALTNAGRIIAARLE